MLSMVIAAHMVTVLVSHQLASVMKTATIGETVVMT